MRVWDVAARKDVAAFPVKSLSVAKVAYSPDGALVAGGGTTGHVCACDPATGKIVWKKKPSKEDIADLAFSPDSGVLIVGTWDKGVLLLGARDGAPAGTIDVGPADMVQSLSMSADGILAIFAIVTDVPEGFSGADARPTAIIRPTCVSSSPPGPRASRSTPSATSATAAAGRSARRSAGPRRAAATR